MEYNFLSATILLILITDPFGNIPLFISCLRGVAKRRRPVVILREIAIAFVILLLFMLAGNSFLRTMGLTDTSLRIGGGIVLFLIAVRMIFPHPDGLFAAHPFAIAHHLIGNWLHGGKTAGA